VRALLAFVLLAAAAGLVLVAALWLWRLHRTVRATVRGGTATLGTPGAGRHPERWIELRADGSDEALALRLLAGQRVEVGVRTPVEIWGQLKPNGLAVVRTANGVLWPAGRLQRSSGPG
jgi:hypothetical protein